ncbi:DUF421 domain-containing protein [Ralstonia insidiosa]|jgi:uncharacterized membrane protein YcaP (DUF421 family)|uniref:DUF421 domain-containing protein n=1 Tax=Ralstonia TaxID=48736 RepID=UPI000664967A|nr:YetF domain-containing protein [Ralstonia insidiosa]KMW45504.1 membrane protein [Ralstonia sp. MD27]MBX3772321.1 DUF421 domain-containing protein [Ralstonia pickettii]NOZ17372.1 DUF421 domain-containing protein [Betaproteobacteria bacterium]MBA9856977.1 DUF421 domain-containing protein [Ralstonia insidiosa]MBA9873595.1 DUF421 domain-containing protein [Ralstonia insidiosa]
MDTLFFLFGEGKDLNPLQAVMRAVVVFLLGLLLVRLSGRRSFGQRSPFDYVVAILLGATLSRAIVGASPFMTALSASLALVVLHRLLGWACVRSRALERFIAGHEREIYRDGRYDHAQMSAALVTYGDIQESARQKLGQWDLHGVEAVILERNGELSLVAKRR